MSTLHHYSRASSMQLICSSKVQVILTNSETYYRWIRRIWTSWWYIKQSVSRHISPLKLEIFGQSVLHTTLSPPFCRTAVVNWCPLTPWDNSCGGTDRRSLVSAFHCSFFATALKLFFVKLPVQSSVFIMVELQC